MKTVKEVLSEKNVKPKKKGKSVYENRGVLVFGPTDEKDGDTLRKVRSGKCPRCNETLTRDDDGLLRCTCGTFVTREMETAAKHLKGVSE